MVLASLVPEDISQEVDQRERQERVDIDQEEVVMEAMEAIIPPLSLVDITEVMDTEDITTVAAVVALSA